MFVLLFFTLNIGYEICTVSMLGSAREIIYIKALVSWLTVYLQLGAKVLHVGLAGAR